MNIWFLKTKIFAYFILLFVSFSVIKAQDSIYELPSGTKMRLKMDNEINSKVSSVNDTFTATLIKPLIVRETTVLPVGTIVEGRVVKVERAAGGGGSGSLAVKFETIKLTGGAKREIDGDLTNVLKAEKSTKFNVLTIIGGAGIGAIIGAVFKSGSGAGIGAAAGAGAGTIVALVRKGRDVRIKTGEEFEIELKKNVTLPVLDY